MTLSVQRFSTTEVEAADRVELWEQHNAQALLGLAARTLDDEPLDAVEHNVRAGALDFARVRAGGHMVERSARHIAAGARDEVVLYFTLAGESFFYHREGVLLLGPGDLLVCDVNQPFSRGFVHGLEELVLKVPRPLFDELSEARPLGEPLRLRFGARPDADAHATSLARLVQATVAGGGGLADAARTEEQAMTLLRAVFSREGRNTSDAHLAAALRLIDRRLGDPRLSVPVVAAGIGLSERHLARVFREHGTSVAHEILERRLARADAQLRSPSAPPIGTVAQLCGFGSHAHFTRAFSARFGMTPTAARRQSQEAEAEAKAAV